MDILIIHQYFRTPKSGGATRTFWLGKSLVDNGHNVIILTSPVPEQAVLEAKEANIKLKVIGRKYHSNMSYISRSVVFLTFMLKSFWEIIEYRKVDLIIATSTPLTVGIPALFANKLFKTKYVFEVRDLWPAVPIQLGIIKSFVLKKILRCLEKNIYTNSELVVALSEGMRKGVLEVHSGCAVEVISNFCKNDVFDIAKTYDVKSDDVITLGYFGSLGFTNAPVYFIESLKFLDASTDRRFKLILAGEGAYYNELLSVNFRNIEIMYYGSVDYNTLRKLFLETDLSLVLFSDFEILSTNSPNKLFDSISAGIAICVNKNGWMRDLVETWKCGYYLEEKDSQALSRLMKSIEIEEIRKFGLNARRLAENVYDRDVLLNKYRKLIEKCAGQSK